MKVLLLNGPPQAGKDEAAKAAMRALQKAEAPFIHAKFSAPIKGAWSGMGIPYTEATKELPHPAFGVSHRQWAIDFSEKFMKPLYGQDIFARLMISHLETFGNETVVISDCGFQVEFEALLKWTRLTELWLITLTRRGVGITDFGSDSREFINPYSPQGKLRCHQYLKIINDGGLDDLGDVVEEYILKWLNG